MLLIGLAELEKRSRSSSTVSNVRMNCSGFVCCKRHRAGCQQRVAAVTPSEHDTRDVTPTAVPASTRQPASTLHH